MTDIHEAKIYFKKLKQAEEYCNGDVELAKKLLAGEFKDTIVFKGRFKDIDDKVYGLFVVIINKVFSSIIGSDSIISHFASIYRHKPLDYWGAFLNRLSKEKEEADYDQTVSEQINNSLKRFLEITGVNNIIFMAESNDIANLTDQFRSIIQEVIKFDDIQILMDFEHTTSIEVYEKTGAAPV